MEKLVRKDSHGNSIHLYVYKPKTTAKAVVQIIHGAAEHFARYGLFAEFLTQNGYAVVGCDILGHGLSTDTYDYVHFGDRDGDKIAFESLLLTKDYIVKTFPKAHVYLLGHSMGSFLSPLLVRTVPDFYKKVVFSGATIASGFMINVGIVLARLIRIFKGPKHVSPLLQTMLIDSSHTRMRKDKLISGINEEWLTKDKTIQDYYHNSQMCGQPFTVSANLALLTWLKDANSHKNLLKLPKGLPILFISGMCDPLSNYGAGIRATHAFLQKSGFTDVSMILYESDRHEVLNETDREKVYQDVLNFFEK